MSETITTTANYTIPACNLLSLQDNITKLNKRGEKLGCSPIVLTVEHSHWMHGIQVLLSTVSTDSVRWVAEKEVAELLKDDRYRDTGARREYLKLTLTGVSPKIAGWHLVSTLEPIEIDGKYVNMVREVPGMNCPAEYRDVVGECHHCKAKRRRSETFVLAHEDGRTAMVGRNCIKDFLGHKDPHALAAMAEFLMLASGYCSEAEEDGGWGGGRTSYVYSVEVLLGWAASIIRKEGWVSGKAASECGKTSTASLINLILGYVHPSARREVEVLRYKFQPEEQDLELASNAMAWALALPIDEKSSSYLYNCNLLARIGNVELYKHCGVVASIVVAYCRQQEREINRKQFGNTKLTSQHQGTIGERREFTVLVTGVNSFESQFGVTHLNRMLDRAGNVYVWWSSTSDLEQGQAYTLKGTVKEHSDYKGTAQTLLSRCTVITEHGSELPEVDPAPYKKPKKPRVKKSAEVSVTVINKEPVHA